MRGWAAVPGIMGQALLDLDRLALSTCQIVRTGWSLQAAPQKKVLSITMPFPQCWQRRLSATWVSVTLSHKFWKCKLGKGCIVSLPFLCLSVSFVVIGQMVGQSAFDALGIFFCTVDDDGVCVCVCGCQRDRWLRESGDPGRVKHSWVQDQGQSHKTKEGGRSIDWQRVKLGHLRQESDHAVFKQPLWRGLWQFHYGRWVEDCWLVCERDMWASHMQGHAEQDSCILCAFAVVLKGRKWTNECLCVYFQSNLVMQEAVCRFLYILSSICKNAERSSFFFYKCKCFHLYYKLHVCKKSHCKWLCVKYLLYFCSTKADTVY